MLIFNIYIGQSNYLKISLLGPPMVDPTPVSHSIAIIYFVARFFRLFVLSTMGEKASVKKTVRWTVFSEGISSDTLILMCNSQAW